MTQHAAPRAVVVVAHDADVVHVAGDTAQTTVMPTTKKKETSGRSVENKKDII